MTACVNVTSTVKASEASTLTFRTDGDDHALTFRTKGNDHALTFRTKGNDHTLTFRTEGDNTSDQVISHHNITYVV